MEKNKPGVMLYFDTIDSIEQLSGDQCRQLIIAMKCYGKDEEEPDFGGDEKLNLLWPMVRGGLNRDDSRYGRGRVNKQYGAYCKAMTHNGLSPLSRENWEMAGCPTYKQTVSGIPPEPAKTSAEFAENAPAKPALAENAPAKPALADLPYSFPIPSSISSSIPVPHPPPPSPATGDGGAAAVQEAEDTGFLKVMKEIRNLIPQLSPFREDLLKQYYSQVGADVCIRAIYDAIDANLENGLKKWSYVETTLKRCAESGIRSLADWNASEEQRRAQRAGQRAGDARQEKGGVHTAEEYLGDGNFHLHRK